VSLKRIINVPTRGLGKKTLGLLSDYARENQISFFQALKQVSQIQGLQPKAQKEIEKFIKIRYGLNKKRFGILVSEFIESVLDETGLLEDLQKENSLEAKSRIENLKEFISVAVDFESNPLSEEIVFTEETEGKEVVQDRLRDFLESITLATDLDKWSPEEDSLTLMTLHMAKGLEFPYVFMVGMEEEIFPHANSMTRDPDDMEEERRLCYVGITRAMERATITFASSRMLYGFRDSKPPSRFIHEIPQQYLKYLGPGLSFDDGLLDDLPFVTGKRERDSEFGEKEFYMD